MKILDYNIFSTELDRNSEARKLYISEQKINASKDDLYNYGFDYFDNELNGYAYKGYFYDGRYKKIAINICKFFNIKAGEIILEIGCAKGFLLKSFSELDIDCFGLDYSKYAVENCHPDLKGKILKGDCSKLEDYPKINPDFIISKETLPHLEKEDINTALNNMKKIIKNPLNILIQIQYIENISEKEKIMAFDPTHKTLQTKKEWIKDLHKANYNGYVHFKRLF